MDYKLVESFSRCWSMTDFSPPLPSQGREKNHPNEVWAAAAKKEKYVEGIKRMIDRQLEESRKEEQLKRKEISGLFGNENARLHLAIEGAVQGVGFRAFAKIEADKLGLTGWVRNKHEKVELVAEGQKDNLQRLLELCKKGPSGAQVDKIVKTWEEFKGEFSGFDVH